MTKQYKTSDRMPMVEAARRLYEEGLVPFSAIADAWGFNTFKGCPECAIREGRIPGKEYKMVLEEGWQFSSAKDIYDEIQAKGNEV